MSIERRQGDDDSVPLEVTLVLTRQQMRSLAEQLARGTALDHARTRVRLQVEAATTKPAPKASDESRPEDPQPLDTRCLINDLAQLGDEVPSEEWAKLPPDLTDQLDHYLYGTPRR